MLPKIKKSILGFLLDEEGQCSKKNALRMGILSLALSAAAARVHAASSSWSVVPDRDQIGLTSDGRLTQPVRVTSGGYDSIPEITLKFSFNQLQDVGIYRVPGTDFSAIDMRDMCQTFECGAMSDHLSDSSCCAVNDHFSDTSTIDLPAVHYHKNALLIEAGEGSVLTAQHTHELGDDSPGRIGCILSEHVNHYNTDGNPCGHDDPDHLSTSTATGWVESEFCGEED